MVYDEARADSRPGDVLRHYCLGLAPLFALAAAIFVLVGGDVSAAAFFDEARRAARELKPLITLLTKYGNFPFYAAFALIALRSRHPDRRGGLHYVLCYLFLLVLLLMIADTLKIWIGRPRPGEPGEYIFMSLEKARHSFPSNHMTETAFSLLALAQYFRNRLFTLACGFWMAAMGFTRLYLGRHHPTDLLGSALLGCLAAYLLLRLADSGRLHTSGDAARLSPGTLAPPHSL